MNTYYRVKETGQWCEPCYENGGAEPEAIAETLGLPVGSIERIDTDGEDPRTGILLADPNAGVEES